MKSITILIFCLLTALCAFGQSCRDSVTVSAYDVGSIINKLLDCQSNDSISRAQIKLLMREGTLCNREDSVNARAIENLKKEISWLKMDSRLADNIIRDQKNDIDGLKAENKRDRRTATRRIIGFTFGGVAIGVLIPTILLL